MLRTLPEMKVFCPADAMQVRAGLRASLAQDAPVYMRIGKKNEPLIHDEVPNLELGRAIALRAGSDACLVVTGVMVPSALAAAEQLAERGVSVHVENFHTVKPLDTERLSELSERFPVMAVIEEHGRIGGLYGAIAEWYAGQANRAMRVLAFGSEDRFLHEIGTQDFARQHYGMSVTDIIDGVAAALP